MRLDLMIVTLAVALTGCTGSSRRGDTVPVFSEVPSPPQLDAHIVTNDSPATNMYRNAKSEEIIQVGSALLVTFTNLPSSGLLGTFGGVRSFQLEPEPMPAFDQQVKDDGTISLIYNRGFQAAGKRIGDLEKEIRDYYVPAYFTNLAVTVRLSAETPVVYVDGEFRNPGLYPWTNGMRLKDAIDAAGGFTEFANHRIKIVHGDGTVEKYRLRSDWASTNNPVLKAGDRIHNPRMIF